MSKAHSERTLSKQPYLCHLGPHCHSHKSRCALSTLAVGVEWVVAALVVVERMGRQSG
jgi:hypothetical protein